MEKINKEEKKAIEKWLENCPENIISLLVKERYDIKFEFLNEGGDKYHTLWGKTPIIQVTLDDGQEQEELSFTPPA